MKQLELTDDQEKELYRLLRLYDREAKRCQTAKAYLAGCVMAAAAMEAQLILMVNVCRDEVSAIGKIPRKPLLKWDLGALLTIAKAVGWLPAGLDVEKDDWIPRRAKVGDRAEVVRMIRNLLHPGRYADEHHHKRVTQKYLKFALDVVLEVNDWLHARINKLPLEHMEGSVNDNYD